MYRLCIPIVQILLVRSYKALTSTTPSAVQLKCIKLIPSTNVVVVFKIFGNGKNTWALI